jgi:hypothetical protein
MASKKFDRKIREVAAQVMEEGEEFRVGLAGRAGLSAASEAGVVHSAAQTVRMVSTIARKMFNALVILGDRNMYLIRTPRLSAWKVEDVVLTEPVATLAVEDAGDLWLRIGDYMVHYTIRLGSEAKELVQMAAENQT